MPIGEVEGVPEGRPGEATREDPAASISVDDTDVLPPVVVETAQDQLDLPADPGLLVGTTGGVVVEKLGPLSPPARARAAE